MYHALALIAVGLLAERGLARASMIGGLFCTGILLFSGSLYLLVLLDLPWMGAVTPLGGVAFIAGWVTLALNGRTDTADRRTVARKRTTPLRRTFPFTVPTALALHHASASDSPTPPAPPHPRDPPARGGDGPRAG